jgi:radical SAM superfamily enzyme YgiQ (UPF0313 family)
MAEICPTRLTRKHVQIMSKIRIGVQIGFEALMDTLLKKMDKMHRFAENIHALKFGKDYELNISGLNIIRNLPDECEDDIIGSIENLKYLRFFLNRYNLFPSELTLYKGTRYYQEVSSEEREERWVINVLLDEVKRAGIVEDAHEWDFFGFKAKNLNYHQLWDQFNYLLQRFQSNDIYYSWLEFSDGSSQVMEYNNVSGHKKYLLSKLETDILKSCDSITSLHNLINEFSTSEHDIEEAVSQLKKEKLLYVDKEKERLISILSIESLTKAYEACQNIPDEKNVV